MVSKLLYILAFSSETISKPLSQEKEEWLAQRSQKWLNGQTSGMQSDPKDNWKLGLPCLSPSHLLTVFTFLTKLSSS